jgi:protein arginine kinase activator
MKCDRCDQEATVHELRVVGGKKVERHLCEQCARDQGIQIQSHIPINELIQKYVLAQTAPQKGAAGAKQVDACPACGVGWAEFRQSGLLGCPDCYAAFELQLSPLLERAHEGGLRHVGKVPRRALSGAKGRPAAILGGPAERAERLLTLQKQLDEAVRSEQYERAAAIRDEIKRLAEIQGGQEPRP